MTEIKLNQELEVNNLLSFRGKVRQSELDGIGRDMEAMVNEAGAKRAGTPITATYGVEGETLDVEILLPVDGRMSSVGKYTFKEKIKIVNALKLEYKGHPSGLQPACTELNQYMINNKMQPITVGYNVTKHIEPLNPDNTEIHVYVGISPNIL